MEWYLNKKPIKEFFPSSSTSASSAQVNIVSIVMVNFNLSQHSIVLVFRLPQRRTVVSNDNQFVSDDNQFPFRTLKGFENSFIPKGILSTLHDKSEPLVDALMSLLGLLCGHHCWRFGVRCTEKKMQWVKWKCNTASLIYF